MRAFFVQMSFWQLFSSYMYVVKASETTFVRKICTFNVDEIDIWCQYHQHFFKQTLSINSFNSLVKKETGIKADYKMLVKLTVGVDATIWKYVLSRNTWKQIGQLMFNINDFQVLPIKGMSCSCLDQSG